MEQSAQEDPRWSLLAEPFDRLNEAHWYLHQMEHWFHEADPFRYSLNAFLKSLREVPQILSMSLQGEEGFAAWFSERRAELHRDPLVSQLYKSRDYVVHHRSLMVKSTAFCGISRGKGLKLGLGMPIDPREDSDHFMHRFASTARDHGDVTGFFVPEDEDTMPCIDRTWRLPEFPDRDAVDLAADAWHTVARLVDEASVFIGLPSPLLRLECPHGSDRVRLRLYSRKDLADFVYANGSRAAEIRRERLESLRSRVQGAEQP